MVSRAFYALFSCLGVETAFMVIQASFLRRFAVLSEQKFERRNVKKP